MKLSLKNTLFNVLMGLYSIPTLVGTNIVQRPIHKTACLIAKHGKVKKYTRGEKFLMGMMFSGDILGFIVSSTPLIVTAFPYLIQNNELYSELEKILRGNEK